MDYILKCLYNFDCFLIAKQCLDYDFYRPKQQTTETVSLSIHQENFKATSPTASHPN